MISRRRRRGRCSLHDAFVYEEDGVHEPVQKGASHVLVSAPLVSILYLPGDLEVANNLGIQANRYFKEVLYGLQVLQRSEMLLETGFKAFDKGESAEDLGRKVRFGIIVNLGAVAR